MRIYRCISDGAIQMQIVERTQVEYKINVYVYIHIRAYIYMYMYMCVYIHTYIYINILYKYMQFIELIARFEWCALRVFQMMYMGLRA